VDPVGSVIDPLDPVGYAIDMGCGLSATPATSPIGVGGVGDRFRFLSLA
jgi:hypothetical protein